MAFAQILTGISNIYVTIIFPRDTFSNPYHLHQRTTALELKMLKLKLIFQCMC